MTIRSYIRLVISTQIWAEILNDERVNNVQSKEREDDNKEDKEGIKEYEQKNIQRKRNSKYYRP